MSVGCNLQALAWACVATALCAYSPVAALLEQPRTFSLSVASYALFHCVSKPLQQRSYASASRRPRVKALSTPCSVLSSAKRSAGCGHHLPRVAS